MAYVHGYSSRETQRLLEQSLILEDLLHTGTRYPSGSRVLEIGCGVGAQTRLLLRRNPGILLTSIDISGASIDEARAVISEEGYTNVSFLEQDLYEHTLDPGSFDHVFICFLLEHVDDPVKALRLAGELIRIDGTLTIIEGDHGSGCWSPETAASMASWQGLIEAQRRQGHDPNIGRRLYPLLTEAGLDVQQVSPRPVYADSSDPELLGGVVNKIIHPMVYSAEDQVLHEGIVFRDTWFEGLEDLSRVASLREGSFFYTWYKGEASRRS